MSAVPISVEGEVDHGSAVARYGDAVSEPVRTCVGCRRRSEKKALLRVVWSDGQVVVDERQAAPGRGAYLHPDPKCLAQAAKKRAFGRALRVEGIGTDQLAGLAIPV